MKETPILFNGEMVRAILEGRKTETRRPVKDGPDESHYRYPVVDKYGDCQWFSDKDDIGYEDELDDEGEYPDVFPEHDEAIRSPFGCIGDRLWVRETWGWALEASMPPSANYKEFLRYRADGDEPDTVDKWVPSIHMPRWASRIMLEVTDIRVERVQEISEEDAEAEGIKIANEYTPFASCWDYIDKTARSPSLFNPSDSFATLWESVYGTWDANPWVWVATFKKVEAAQ